MIIYYWRGLLLLAWALAVQGCGLFSGAAETDFRWQQCAGTIRIVMQPGLEAGEVVEHAVVTCDSVEVLRPWCAERIGVEYHVLLDGKIGVVLRCADVVIFSGDGLPGEAPEDGSGMPAQPRPPEPAVPTQPAGGDQ